jgi:hypothetical protein
MLPLFRIIPVGGVFLAIMIVILALEPPGATRAALTSAQLPARGALLRVDEHPEWRQNLILAAVRRADELSRLRELPDTPVRNDSKIASLPAQRSGSDPELVAATTGAPRLPLPREPGEISSAELTAAAPQENPPALKTPERKASSAPRKKPTHRVRHAKTPSRTQATPARRQAATQPGLFQTMFGGQRTYPPTAQDSGTSITRPEQY